MKIGEMLALVDEMKPNSVDRARKIGWLSDVDRRVFADIISRHEKDESAPGAFEGYTEETDENTILLIQEPHSEIYRWFLEMQIDLANMASQPRSSIQRVISKSISSRPSRSALVMLCPDE